MSNKRLLSEDFTISKYGISARLVREEDSDFIVRLRTNEALSRYLHSIDDNVEKQREWIRNYKKREEEGKDYYFLYYCGERNLGVGRIYNIDGGKAMGGSWICDPSNLMEHTIATMLLGRDIFFDELYFPQEVFQVSKGNNKVLKLHLRMGAKIVVEREDEYELILTKENYLIGKNKIIHLLNF